MAQQQRETGEKGEEESAIHWVSLYRLPKEVEESAAANHAVLWQI
jgi:hypothetical protein